MNPICSCVKPTIWREIKARMNIEVTIAFVFDLSQYLSM